MTVRSVRGCGWNGLSRPVAAALAISLVLAAAGCGSLRGPMETGGRDPVQSITVDGRERSCIVHVPPSYDGSKPVPLVLVFHGGTGNAEGMIDISGMNGTADQEGFIAAYPNGTGLLEDRILTWNVLFGFGYASRNSVDDVGFVRELVSNLRERYSIDPARIYATGLSNGGMLAYLLGSELGDVLAAVAPVAGAISAKPDPDSDFITFPPPVEPVPVIVFHGREDGNVPYDGGQGSGLSRAVYAPVNFSIGKWVEWNGCSNEPVTTTTANGNVVTQTYGGGRNGSEVVLVTINDGGHAWPGGNRYPGGPRPSMDISANDVMWEFFLEHPRQMS